LLSRLTDEIGGIFYLQSYIQAVLTLFKLL